MGKKKQDNFEEKCDCQDETDAQDKCTCGENCKCPPECGCHRGEACTCGPDCECRSGKDGKCGCGCDCADGEECDCEECACDECESEECQDEACECEHHHEKHDLAGEYLAMAQRLQADFDNYRKRVAEQFDRERQEGVKSVIEVFLPCLDAFKEAKKSVKDENTLVSIP